ncbi:hypothetical protein N9R79_01055 [Vibrio sp.]|nr:hypothetical protein [Vibrio sp.]
MGEIKLGHCSTNNIQFSTGGREALRQIHDKISAHKNMVYLTGATAVIDVLVKQGKPMDKLWNIAGYDWKTFGEVVSGLSNTIREQIRKISHNQLLFGPYKERAFWECVVQATL